MTKHFRWLEAAKVFCAIEVLSFDELLFRAVGNGEKLFYTYQRLSLHAK